jgi:GntR family transcriptional regulator of arabinose operon
MRQDPLYLRIKEILREDFLNAYSNGEMEVVPSLNDLQTKYQVSRPTLSKALTALAAEGLLVKQAGRGMFTLSPAFQGDPSAAPPRVTIGYIAPIYGAELPQNIFKGIDRIANRRNYRVLMAGTGDNIQQERMAAMEMIAAGVKGLIIYPTNYRNCTPKEDYLRSSDIGIPIVLVDTCTPEFGHTQVLFDNRRAGYQMTRWLTHQGHKRIALYLLSIAHPSLEARIKGYQDALRDQSIPFDPTLIYRFHPNEDETEIDAHLTEILRAPNPPTAIMAYDDMMAISIIQSLTRLGIQVPEDICVTGFDHRIAARHYQPAFTTTNPDFEMMGEVACEMLIDKIESGGNASQTYVLPTPILIRRHNPRTDTRSGIDENEKNITTGTSSSGFD